MPVFNKYVTEVNDDGTYNVLNLEIFGLGEHRGFNYDDKWFAQVQKKHQELEAKGYIPPVVIGHNNKNLPERKACGFFNNLRIDGDMILADLIKIPEEVYEDIKDRLYPYRSIEVSPEDFEITALALLGGSEPYFKLPMLEVFNKATQGTDKVMGFQKHRKETGKKDYIRFSLTEPELSIAEEVDQNEKTSKLRKWYDVISTRISNALWGYGNENLKPKEIKKVMLDTMQEGIAGIEKIDTGEEPSAGEEADVQTYNQQQENENMADQALTKEQEEQIYKDRFTREHGCSPEEFSKRQMKAKTDARKLLVDGFAKQLDDKKVSGAAKEKIIAFMNREQGSRDAEQFEADQVPEFQTLIMEIIGFAAGDTLIVDTDEHAQHGSDVVTEDDHPDAEVEQAVYSIMRKDKCSFEVAFTKYEEEKARGK